VAPNDLVTGPAVFVTPHWSDGKGRQRQWLKETLESIQNQTDSNWRMLIADGNSPSDEAKADLRALERQLQGRLEVIFMPHSDGPGHARNVAIKRAHEAGYPFIVFLDADDIAHPKRVEVARRHFAENTEAGVVYSTFEVIDELSRPVTRERLSKSIVEILESHEQAPPQGKEAWIRIGTETGYTNLTSATSVRTEIAFRHPFPPEKVSEDYHTWLRYSAAGAEFIYTSLTPTRYRIPQDSAGSASRSREGGRHGFYATKCRVDALGFQEALRLARQRGAIKEGDVDRLRIKFYLKEAETMGRENEMELARDCFRNAREINVDQAVEVLRAMQLQDRSWAT
jgi:glycosyltransferase involved in cell wall biosynthesis